MINRTFYRAFLLPLLVLFGMAIYGICIYFDARYLAFMVAVIAIAIGSFDLVVDSIQSLRRRQFALDYIAIMAIAMGIFTAQYFVALVIAFMLTTGRTLEKYGLARARQSLTALSDRIPREVLVWGNGRADQKKLIAAVQVGESIVVRKGEVVPLDGVLVSDNALTDESSLTGEPYVIDKIRGDTVRSGTINAGNVLVLRVTTPDRDSTYRKIIGMVERAQLEKAPLVRLANRYSTIFTVITGIVAFAAYFATNDIYRVLAVLVVATPCPLILATPIALFGGMNAAARERILVKKLASLEILARVTDIIFDKTGTITLGRPAVKSVDILDRQYSLPEIYSIVEAIERNSLHPLAKALVVAARNVNAPHLAAQNVEEKIGIGISADVGGVHYTLAKLKDTQVSHAVELLKDLDPVARFEFTDAIKEDSRAIMATLKRFGLQLHMYTGDRAENARRVTEELGEVGRLMTVKAECSPEDKKDGIEALRRAGRITAMVGDGINDAPALAMADVGLVFSNEEQTASSEAADIVFLGGDVSHVSLVLAIAKRTIRIALQSIGVGIGLSFIAMIAAAFGYIPPVVGAILQEGIDVLVILNALRASRFSW